MDKYFFRYLSLCAAILVTASCSIQKQVSKSVEENLLDDSTLSHAHLGLHFQEAATGKVWYNYQGDHYFVPASNTKIITLYASLKYLGDSLESIRYRYEGDKIRIQALGDPTLLHPDFPYQPVAAFLRKEKKEVVLDPSLFKANEFGAGWSWSDYDEYYQPERSALPIYGNVVRVRGTYEKLSISPSYFKNYFTVKDTVGQAYPSSGTRKRYENIFTLSEKQVRDAEMDIPFMTNKSEINASLLSDTLKVPVSLLSEGSATVAGNPWRIIKSQKTDSLARLMMYRSDNFYAEQMLLMCSYKKMGYMKESDFINTLLESDLKDFPQKPGWADGSGLSRYNLFTPQDFVWILGKMKDEFGFERLKNIFATGGTGTLRNFYKADSSFIYAKTGTLGGVVSLSGYLITQKGKILIFSVLVNNHNGSATAVRRKVEAVLSHIRKKY